MRVISGIHKGRLLKTVRDLSVRPATDRVKQTVFDMLVHRVGIEDTTVLDLFAGSGALGIEALSRGASRVTFVEQDSKAVSFIEMNLEMIGAEKQSALLEMDAVSFIKRCNDSFDLIFADPPYAYDETPNIPKLVFERGMLKRYGYLVIEHSKDIRFTETDAYRVGPEKKFGRTLVTFFRHHEESAAT